MKRTLSLALCALLLAGLAACGGSPAPSSSSAPAPSSSASSSAPAPDPMRPATLTGLAVPMDYAGGKRIAAVVVDNHPNARPQRGLSSADILFEVLVEGGITRFMALYEDYQSMPVTGPVRSGRDTFLQLCMAYQPLFLCDGYSQTLRQYISDYEYDELELGRHRADVIIVDEERPGDPLYANYTSGTLLAQAVQTHNIDDERQYNSTFFHFVPYDDARALANTGADSLVIAHSEDYLTTFALNGTTGRYEMRQNTPREGNATTPTVDENNSAQLNFVNLLVLFAEMPAYDGMAEDVRDVQFGLGGVGYYFYNGDWERIRWMKDSPLHTLELVEFEDHVTPVQLNAGNTYVALVDVEQAAQFAFGPAGAEARLGDS